MKKKLACTFLVFSATFLSWSQELHITSGSSVSIFSSSYVYVNNNVVIDEAAHVTVYSDATKSASFIVNGSVSGEISYEKNINTTNWHIISSPVTTQDIGTFAVDPTNDIKISESNNYGISIYENGNTAGFRWTYYSAGEGPQAVASAGNFVNGKGYANLRNSVGSYTFKGGVATENEKINIPAKVITPLTSSSHLWSAVGNPYPFFLPANNNANTTNNILKQNIANLNPSKAYLLFWDGSTYQVINQASEALYVAPGQGFLVDPNGNNITFTFPKNLQIPQVNTTTTFYKTAPTPTITVQLSNGTETVKTTLKYFSNTTTGLDVGYDAGTYVDTKPTFSIDTHLVSDSAGIDFTLQCLPNSNYETSVVPLSIKAQANQTITFNSIASNLPEGIDVYLEDKQAKTFTKITTHSYQVTLSEQLKGIGRFYLHTSTENTLNIEDNILLTNLINIYNTSNTNLRITSLRSLKDNALIKIYSVIGEQILSRSFKVQNVNDIGLPNNLSSGLYIVQLIVADKKISKKIIIK